VRAKWRIKTRGWKNSGSQRSSLSPLLSLVRIFPAENQNRGFEKAGGSEQESICFLFFSSGILGERTKKKAPNSPYLQNSFLEIAKKKKTKEDFMKFLFSRFASNQLSPSYDFLFLSFLFFFFSPIIQAKNH
jgi:hypothetical protein